MNNQITEEMTEIHTDLRSIARLCLDDTFLKRRDDDVREFFNSLNRLKLSMECLELGARACKHDAQSQSLKSMWAKRDLEGGPQQ